MVSVINNIKVKLGFLSLLVCLIFIFDSIEYCCIEYTYRVYTYRVINFNFVVIMCVCIYVCIHECECMYVYT